MIKIFKVEYNKILNRGSAATHYANYAYKHSRNFSNHEKAEAFLDQILSAADLISEIDVIEAKLTEIEVE